MSEMVEIKYEKCDSCGVFYKVNDIKIEECKLCGKKVNPHTINKILFSHCCTAPIKIEKDETGNSFHICLKCNKPCYKQD